MHAQKPGLPNIRRRCEKEPEDTDLREIIRVRIDTMTRAAYFFPLRAVLP
jgi:hypothetical protein